jgi:hypothetical protein
VTDRTLILSPQQIDTMIRLAKAEALREAAGALSNPQTGPLRRRDCSRWARQWLNERAAAVEGGA